MTDTTILPRAVRAPGPVITGPGGLSGYPSRSESVHDLVENSHASTALSYADGLARAARLRGEHDRHVVAVVGDGTRLRALLDEGRT